MKRPMIIAAALLVATLLATGGKASRTVEPRVGFVAFAGSAPTRHTLDGSAFVGFLQAEKQLPIRGRVVYVAPTQDASGVLASFGRQDYDLVVAPIFDPGSLYGPARRFPRVRFLLVDAQPDSLAHRAKNIQRAVFRAEQAGYLAGYLSALMAGREGGRHLISAVGGILFYGAGASL